MILIVIVRLLSFHCFLLFDCIFDASAFNGGSEALTIGLNQVAGIALMGHYANNNSDKDKNKIQGLLSAAMICSLGDLKVMY